MSEQEKNPIISKEDKKGIDNDLSMIPNLVKCMEKSDSKDEKSKAYFEILEKFLI